MELLASQGSGSKERREETEKRETPVERRRTKSARAMVWRHLFRLSRRSKALHDLPSRLVSPKLRRALHLSGRAEQGQATATIGTSSGSIYGAGFGGLGLGLGLGLGMGVGTNSLVSDKEAGPLDEHFISRAAEKAQPAVVNLTFKSV